MGVFHHWTLGSMWEEMDLFVFLSPTPSPAPARSGHSPSPAKVNAMLPPLVVKACHKLASSLPASSPLSLSCTKLLAWPAELVYIPLIKLP